MKEQDFSYEGIVKINEDNTKSTIGFKCRNCGHIIIYDGLVHCGELDCSCLNPEPEKESD